MTRNELRQRLDRLSETQRTELAAVLNGIEDDRGQNARERGDRVSSSSVLVAYVVRTPDATLEAQGLREWTRDQLPEYMVPATFMFLDRFPMTANGKVDREALPEACFSAETSATPLEPRTHAERVLVEIWADLLGMEAVNVRDNFFELGGDSLLSIRVIARAAEAGLHITAEEFVDNPDIQSLAALAKVNGPDLNDQVEGTLPRNRSGTKGLTPSDFPLADLNKEELDKISTFFAEEP